MSEVAAAVEPHDALTEHITRYRDLRDRIERSTLPLATSIDGRVFELQASLHGLSLERGATSCSSTRVAGGSARSPT